MKIVFVAVAALCLGAAVARQVPVKRPSAAGPQNSSRPAEAGEYATRDSRGWLDGLRKITIGFLKHAGPVLVIEGIQKAFSRDAFAHSPSDGMAVFILPAGDIPELAALAGSAASGGQEQLVYHVLAASAPRHAAGAYMPSVMSAYPFFDSHEPRTSISPLP